MKKTILITLILSISVATFTAEIKRILIVHSYHQGFYWTDEQNRGIIEALSKAEENTIVETNIFYLENRRYPDTGNILLENHIELIGNDLPDLIITTDNYAFDLLANSQWRLSNRMPMVFCGVNNFSISMINNLPLITGVAENFHNGRIETINAAIQLYPRTKNLVFIMDTSSTCQAIQIEIELIKT